MLFHQFRNEVLAFGLVVATVGMIAAQAAEKAQNGQPIDAEDKVTDGLNDMEIEELTRGPIHEAFAEPIAENARPNVIAPKKPPELIDEIAPEIKLGARGSIWIPGYWAWDDERNDFLWVSGVWRVPPPNQRWIPGYWQEVVDPVGSYRWISGFWVADNADNIEYLPAPPPSLEAGPSSPLPSSSHFWVPGCWVHHTSDFRWRPGYWTLYRPNWLWIPAHYVWTPLGRIFLPGYWDWPYAQRGYLYSPIYFPHHIYQTGGFRYEPWLALNVNSLQFSLFIRSGHSHYYFGDFFGHHYSQKGFQPWTKYYESRPGFDPYLTHNQIKYGRQGFDYAGRIDGWNRYYAKHENRRPPRSLNDHQSFVTRDPSNKDLPQSILAQSTKTPMPKQWAGSQPPSARPIMHQSARQLRAIANQRMDLESKAVASVRTDNGNSKSLAIKATTPGKSNRNAVANQRRSGPSVNSAMTAPRQSLQLPKLIEQPRRQSSSSSTVQPYRSGANPQRWSRSYSTPSNTPQPLTRVPSNSYAPRSQSTWGNQPSVVAPRGHSGPSYGTVPNRVNSYRPNNYGIGSGGGGSNSHRGGSSGRGSSSRRSSNSRSSGQRNR